MTSIANQTSARKPLRGRSWLARLLRDERGDLLQACAVGVGVAALCATFGVEIVDTLKGEFGSAKTMITGSAAKAAGAQAVTGKQEQKKN